MSFTALELTEQVVFRFGFVELYVSMNVYSKMPLRNTFLPIFFDLEYVERRENLLTDKPHVPG